jgi:hypothetical protein
LSTPADAHDELAQQLVAALDEANWRALLHDLERLKCLRPLADKAMLDWVVLA